MGEEFTLGNIICAVQMQPIQIKKVIFNYPATIVYFQDGSKEVVKCSKEDIFDKEKGLAFAVMKHIYGGKFNDILREWC